MVIKIYKHDFSPPSCAVFMICEIHKIPVELVNVDLLAREHLQPEFMSKNPLHTIPILEDGDLILHDSHAIITYLTEKYGKDESLYPKDITERALVDQKLYYDVLLFNRIKAIAYSTIFESLTEMTEKLVNPLEEAVGFLETFLSKSKFVAGDTLTIADICVSSTVASIRHIISLDKYPKVEAWFAYFEKQPYFQKYTVPGAAGLGKFLRSKLNL